MSDNWIDVDTIEGLQQATEEIDENTRINVQVKLFNGKAVVRKIIFKQERFILKYGLSAKGDWIRVPEGERYPDECLLHIEKPFVSLYREVSEDEFRTGSVLKGENE